MIEISPSVLVKITDRITPQLEAWRKRTLEKVYVTIWFDAIVFKVKTQGVVKHKCLYNVLGLNAEGKKEILGIYLAETEGAKFWQQVLTDLQNRGVEDILIVCIDNLKGFPEAIETIISQSRNTSVYCTPDQKFTALYYVKRLQRILT